MNQGRGEIERVGWNQQESGVFSKSFFQFCKGDLRSLGLSLPRTLSEFAV